MSPTILHKYKYFHSTVQRTKDRSQKFHFCRLPFDVTSSLIRHFKIEVSRQPQTSKCHVTSRLPSGLPFAVHVSTSGDLSCGKWFTAEFFCDLIIENSCSKAQTCFFLMSFILSNRVYALFPLHQNIFQAMVRLVRVERKTRMAPL